MKYLLSSLLALALPVYSQTEILTFEAVCDTTKKVGLTLLKEFQEMPFLIGKANDEAQSQMIFWINPKLQTWSITSTKGNLTCVIGYGDTLKIITTQPKLKD